MSKAPDGVSMCIFTPSIEGSLKAVNMMSTIGSTNSSNHCLTLVFLQNLAFSGSAILLVLLSRPSFSQASSTIMALYAK